jgi:hypothetical protein
MQYIIIKEVLDIEEILWQRYLVKQPKPQQQGSYVSPIDLHYDPTPREERLSSCSEMTLQSSLGAPRTEPLELRPENDPGDMLS